VKGGKSQERERGGGGEVLLRPKVWCSGEAPPGELSMPGYEERGIEIFTCM